MYFNGFDKCGRPVWIMRPRLQNSKDGERQIKHIVYSLERGIRLMPDLVENLAIIVDFKDSSASHNPSVSTCKKFLDILGNHYPERLGIAFVVKCKSKIAYRTCSVSNIACSTLVLFRYIQDHFAVHGSCDQKQNQVCL
ncbi:hypothetical protein G6F42_028186 [Rhizopus arrhizus]|nr:hypothetical protein G6F42_028186 [Rhizopus arrhizus]